jgi:CD109 antigen
VGYQYNLNVTGAWPSFVLDPQVTKVSDANRMQVTVCTHFIEKTNVTSSHMAVMEIYLPSGFTVNQDALPALRKFKGVMRVDSERRDTKIVIYFNSIVKKEVCPTVEAFRTHRVANQRPAPVIVYDYYDQSRRARAFYDVVPASLCDICEGEDCPSDGCSTRSQFPNFGSYAFREAYYDDGSASAASKTTAAAVAVGAISVLATLRLAY